MRHAATPNHSFPYCGVTSASRSPSQPLVSGLRGYLVRKESSYVDKTRTSASRSHSQPLVSILRSHQCVTQPLTTTRFWTAESPGATSVGQPLWCDQSGPLLSSPSSTHFRSASFCLVNPPPPSATYRCVHPLARHAHNKHNIFFLTIATIRSVNHARRWVSIVPVSTDWWKPHQVHEV